jgi:hypothetical protein
MKIRTYAATGASWVNSYGSVCSDPLNLVDPYGEDGFTDILVLGSAGSATVGEVGALHLNNMVVNQHLKS